MNRQRTCEQPLNSGARKTNSKLTLLVRELFNRRVPVTEQAFAELVLWELPESLSGSKHRYKYRLAFVAAGECVLRYDNESGKGGHKHVRGKEVKYRFVSADKLVADFFEDVRRWRDENSND